MSKSNQGPTIRYTDQELGEFKDLIEKKLTIANKELKSLMDSMSNVSANVAGKGDSLDTSSSQADLELLQTMVHRQRKHINDLDNALLRIQNGVYGVCMISGNLIDKRRLMAVPTTTKSMAVKTAQSSQNPKEKKAPPVRKGKTILTKIIKPKQDGASNNEIILDDFLEEEDDLPIVDEEMFDIVKNDIEEE